MGYSLQLQIIMGAFAAASMAVEEFKSAKIPISELKAYMLKSHGEVIARIEVPTGTTIEVASADPSGHLTYNQLSRSMTSSKGIVVKIVSGTNSISIVADEMEERKVPASLSSGANDPGLKVVPTRPIKQLPRP